MKIEAPSELEASTLMVDPQCVGTHYPSRIFVGSLPGKATATDLAEFFCQFGTVLEGKVVLDSCGRSRRFGFVTFATPHDVANVLNHGTIFYKGRRINVGPAVKKMSTTVGNVSNFTDFITDDNSPPPSYPSSPGLPGSPIDYPVVLAPPSPPPPTTAPPMLMLIGGNQPPPSPTGFPMVPPPLCQPLGFLPNLSYPLIYDSHAHAMLSMYRQSPTNVA